MATTAKKTLLILALATRVFVGVTGGEVEAGRANIVRIDS